MKKTAFNRGGLPPDFIDRFGQHVTGFISGFDRLRFRATLRPLFQPGGMEIYLYSAKVLVKDFANFAQNLTEQVRQAAYRSAPSIRSAPCPGADLVSFQCRYLSQRSTVVGSTNGSSRRRLSATR